METPAQPPAGGGSRWHRQLNGQTIYLMKQAPFFSFGGVVVALLIAMLSQLAHAVVPPSSADIPCPAQPALYVSLPATLPPAPGATVQATATPVAAISPAAGITPANGTPGAVFATAAPPAEPAPVAVRSLFRADDPPAAHGLAITAGPIMPWVIPPPCRLTAEQRGHRPLPCVTLLPPGGLLCVSGAAGSGRLSSAAGAPPFALQATRVTVRDASGALRIDAVQGFFRYDDPDRGLLLLCPQIGRLERVGPNGRRFVAPCSNGGADGWSVSGQVTDGGSAAPDSVGLIVQAADGRQFPLVGALPVGGISVNDVPDEAP